MYQNTNSRVLIRLFSLTFDISAGQFLAIPDATGTTTRHRHHRRRRRRRRCCHLGDRTFPGHRRSQDCLWGALFSFKKLTRFFLVAVKVQTKTAKLTTLTL